MEQFAADEPVWDRVIVQGKLDRAAAPQLRAILAGVRGDVEVDCTRISFIDRSGFDALTFGYDVATAQGYEFSVTGLSDFAARAGHLLEFPAAPAWLSPKEGGGQRLRRG
jgi:anti-anti-sigma regulatory factor